MNVLAASFYDAGPGRFIISPGFGGAAALLGGLLAYLAAQQKLTRDHEAARQDRWWVAMSWIFEHAATGPHRERIPGGVVLAMLERLFDEARTDLEIQTVDGLLDLFRKQAEGARRPARP